MEDQSQTISRDVGELLGHSDFLGIDRSERTQLIFVVWKDVDVDHRESRPRDVGVSDPHLKSCAFTTGEASDILADIKSGRWKDKPDTFYLVGPAAPTCTILLSGST